MIEPQKSPRLVITGRPNVGKSTLFNRLYGRRRAITDPTPGVTRDTLEEQCTLAGIGITLIDTGGVKVDFDSSFDDIVTYRALLSIKDADLILFLVVIGEFTAEDQHLVEALRSQSAKVILVANKSDTPEKDYLAAELYSLGLGEPIPISSEHGRNIDFLCDHIRRRLTNLSPQSEAPEQVEEPHSSDRSLALALVGKPNVGKSTLANRLSGSNQSLVSEIAGTTRDIVVASSHHLNRPLKIVDTAGIRRKPKVGGDIEYYSVNRALRAMFEADVTVLIVDADEGLSDQDKKIAAQAVKKGKTVVMALNKWDEKTPNLNRLKKAIDKIRFQFPILDWAPVTPVSALKGYGISDLLNLILKADSQQNHRVETGELNRAVREWLDLTPPPTRKGRPFKVRYVTQVSVKPVRFVAFVNRTAGFPDAYRRFLINQIRREFGFSMVPVEMNLREGKK